MERYIIYIIFALIVGGGVFIFFTCECFRDMDFAPKTSFSVSQAQDDKVHEKNSVTVSIDDLIYPDIPLFLYKERITKKKFGILITPENSPVSPERFYGYHTGVDFEVFDTEFDSDVVVRSICDGDVVRSQHINGYGGVVVQSCKINEEDVTVLYGHLRPVALAKNSQSLLYGERVGVLGDDKSIETDGERKHLHLGVKRGTDIDFRGYVQTEEELDLWIDPCDIIDCNLE